ncbi:MAG: alpha/beta fold hydrolase [Chloroflexia bacterium]
MHYRRFAHAAAILCCLASFFSAPVLGASAYPVARALGATAFRGVGAPVSAGPLPGSGSRSFAETGQTVSGIFLDYWDTHGGLAQQGFPISPTFNEVSALDGRAYTVQYFERAVFEYHLENPAPYDVLLSQLGAFQYKQKYPAGAPGQQANNSSGSQLFTETGKRLGGRFLAYWQSHGGLAQQGYPISEEFQERSDLDGKTYTVQYFERAVFELHPENAAPYDVLLSQLGTFRYRQQYSAVHGAVPVEGLFDVGGYRLWLSCTGQGSPTVIFDSALGRAGDDWYLVQPHVAQFTRACSYDRAGLGNSERSPAPRTSEQTMKELHALLAAAKVGGPYVLVGQAEGGLNMQLFAKLYKSEVAGMVLVDAVHPDLDARYIAILTPEQEQQRERGISSTREGASYDDTNLSGAQVRAAGPMPNIPLVVLRHGLALPQPAGWPVAEIERIWLGMQEELAAMVPGSKLVVAEQSRHFIEVDQPELVVDYTREVVMRAKGAGTNQDKIRR